MADGAMTVNAAAEFTGISRTRLYEFMGDAQLPFTVIGGRRLIPKRALVDLLNGNLRGAQELATA